MTNFLSLLFYLSFTRLPFILNRKFLTFPLDLFSYLFDLTTYYEYSFFQIFRLPILIHIPAPSLLPHVLGPPRTLSGQYCPHTEMLPAFTLPLDSAQIVIVSFSKLREFMWRKTEKRKVHPRFLSYWSSKFHNPR